MKMWKRLDTKEITMCDKKMRQLLKYIETVVFAVLYRLYNHWFVRQYEHLKEVRMSMTCAGLGLLLALFMFCAGQAGAQQSATVEKEPKTKLESFQARTGAVVIKGYSRIGNVSAVGTVEVTAMEFTDAATGKKQTGIAIEIKGGRLENTDISFIDYDEVDSLIKGIDYISKVTTEVTKLGQFEATYKTKGSFRATTYSSSRSDLIDAAVSSGYIMTATAFLSLQQLGELRAIIAEAKQKLDSVK